MRLCSNWSDAHINVPVIIVLVQSSQLHFIHTKLFIIDIVLKASLQKSVSEQTKVNRGKKELLKQEKELMLNSGQQGRVSY